MKQQAIKHITSSIEKEYPVKFTECDPGKKRLAFTLDLWMLAEMDNPSIKQIRFGLPFLFL